MSNVRNLPAYRNMLNMVVYAEGGATTHNGRILAHTQLFGPFEGFDSQEIVDALNEDAADPTSCQICQGKGKVHFHPVITNSIVEFCSYCKTGRTHRKNGDLSGLRIK